MNKLLLKITDFYYSNKKLVIFFLFIITTAIFIGVLIVTERDISLIGCNDQTLILLLNKKCSIFKYIFSQICSIAVIDILLFLLCYSYFFFPLAMFAIINYVIKMTIDVIFILLCGNLVSIILSIFLFFIGIIFSISFCITFLCFIKFKSFCKSNNFIYFRDLFYFEHTNLIVYILIMQCAIILLKALVTILLLSIFPISVCL